MRAPNRGLARSGLRSSTTWWRRGARPESPMPGQACWGAAAHERVVNVAIDRAEGKRCATRSAHGNAMNPAQKHAIHPERGGDAAGDRLSVFS